MKKLALALLMVCLFASMGLAAEKKATTIPLSQVEEYDLNERCGKQADVFFKSKYGEKIPRQGYENDYGITTSYDYENHYNKRMNKCFIRIEIMTFKKGKDNISNILTALEQIIFDVNDHKEYGVYLGNEMDPPQICFVSQYSCKSKEEWQALIKTYMEE